MGPLRLLIDLLRGALIGVVEIIPGVSGGTVALIIGVYERLIESIGEFVRGIARAVVDLPRGRGLAAAGGHFARVDWRMIIPLGVGMLVALLVAARLVAPIVEANPVESLAFFGGLMLVALIVPARMVGGLWRVRECVLAALAAVAGFVFSGLPSVALDEPALPMVGLSGALAVCALVLPGMSGSFVLLVLGVYEPTLRAVNERDLAYLGVFIIGMVIGLALFVQLLRWLLRHHHRVTLAIMTGLMAGSLRALWPWQGEERELFAPTGEVWPIVLWFALGVVIVTVMLIVERAITRRRVDPTGAEIDPRS